MMKKAVALIALHSRLFIKDKTQNLSKREVKDEIREIADNDEVFENIVFELGCSVLAKAYRRDLCGQHHA